MAYNGKFKATQLLKWLNEKLIWFNKLAHTNCRAHDERLNFEFCVFTALEDSLFYTPKSTYLAVVAIDFGTTYSGFAFSFIKDQGRDAIFMNMDWVNEQGGETSKTPTCLLLNSDLSFDSFGYEAIDKYAGLEGEGGEKEYLFFKHFKMALYHDQVCLLDHFFMYMYGSGGRGGGWLCCFPPTFLDPLRLPVWRHIATGKSLGSLVQIRKGYHCTVIRTNEVEEKLRS